MKFFRSLVFKLDVADADDEPVTAAALEELRKSLQYLRLQVSGIVTAGMALCGVSLLCDLLHASVGWELTFAASLVITLAARVYEVGGLAASLNAVQPVPDNLCAEMAALARSCAPARRYCDAVRAQGREFVRAEYDAVRDAVHRLVAPEAGRRALYGR